MQTINQLAKTLPQQQPPSNGKMQTGQLLSSITAAAASKELTAMMLDIFGLWKRGFQSKMKHGNYDLLAAQVWAVALQQANVTEHEIGAAYAESIKTSRKGLPSDAGEFLALARNTHGAAYPAAYDAFVMACQNEGKTKDMRQPYPHIVLDFTVMRLGCFTVKTADNRFYPTFEKVYNQVIAEYEAGLIEPLPPSQQLENHAGDKSPPAQPAVANNYILQIKKMLGAANGVKDDSVTA